MRNSIDIFTQAKREHRKLTMVTCYDYTMARIVDMTDIDAVLIGDSLGMTMLGYDSTLKVTMDDMVRATQAVARGCSKPFIVADMPFMSYQADFAEGMHNAGRLISEGGANAVKIEGGTSATITLAQELIDHGVPVIGHLGLTPQSVNEFGGFKAQGKEARAISKLLFQCESCADAGIKAVVLECVPAELAKHITLTFPFSTIGIGAGPDCDCEVQVLHDVLGMSEHKPKHANAFMNGAEVLAEALRGYDQAVKDKQFPGEDNSVHVDISVVKEGERMLDELYDVLYTDDFLDD